MSLVESLANVVIGYGIAVLTMGIDIGAQGAWSRCARQRTSFEVADMPIMRDRPKGRPAVNALLLADMRGAWKGIAREAR